MIRCFYTINGHVVAIESVAMSQYGGEIVTMMRDEGRIARIIEEAKIEQKRIHQGACGGADQGTIGNPQHPGE